MEARKSKVKALADSVAGQGLLFFRGKGLNLYFITAKFIYTDSGIFITTVNLD